MQLIDPFRFFLDLIDLFQVANFHQFSSTEGKTGTRYDFRYTSSQELRTEDRRQKTEATWLSPNNRFCLEEWDQGTVRRTALAC
jgi:hypothetical protein